jgi:hypothetical protein
MASRAAPSAVWTSGFHPPLNADRHQPGALFAAAWSACFESAIVLAARKRKTVLPAEMAIDAEVDLNIAHDGLFLSTRLIKPSGHRPRYRQTWAGGDPNRPLVTDATKQCFECHQKGPGLRVLDVHPLSVGRPLHRRRRISAIRITAFAQEGYSSISSFMRKLLPSRTTVSSEPAADTRRSRSMSIGPGVPCGPTNAPKNTTGSSQSDR